MRERLSVSCPANCSTVSCGTARNRSVGIADCVLSLVFCLLWRPAYGCGDILADRGRGPDRVDAADFGPVFACYHMDEVVFPRFAGYGAAEVLSEEGFTDEAYVDVDGVVGADELDRCCGCGYRQVAAVADVAVEVEIGDVDAVHDVCVCLGATAAVVFCASGCTCAAEADAGPAEQRECGDRSAAFPADDYPAAVSAGESASCAVCDTVADIYPGCANAADADGDGDGVGPERAFACEVKAEL